VKIKLSTKKVEKGKKQLAQKFKTNLQISEVEKNSVGWLIFPKLLELKNGNFLI
jgi:hypothetical protein